MREFLRTTKGRACVILAAVLLLAGLAGGGYALWLYRQPKFHNLTMELGSPMPGVSEFLTQYGKAEKAELVTTGADLTQPGQVSLTFRHGTREETVTLTIQDTTAPEIELRDLVLETGTVPAPEDFVVSIRDCGAAQVRFAEEFVLPETYDDMTVSLLAADESGNVTGASAKITWLWLREAFELELGDTLEKADLLLDPEKDEALLDQQILDEINSAPVGEYVIASVSGGKTATCAVTVRDTTGPELVLKEVHLYAGGTVTLEDFVESASDLSGVAEIRLVTEPDLSIDGEQTITVEAEDNCGNVTSAETKLYIATDNVPPTFSGLSGMTVKKHGSLNYTSGVSATDEKDGKVSFTYDASKVDLDTAGTYYVTYTARDSSGNVATAKRKVTVEHDAEDTAALVKEIAAGVGDDLTEIKNYVKNKIGNYVSSAYGGDDPVWYGFTNRRGNCIVFAKCLKAVLDEKGFETQLIWVTGPSGWEESHYWVLVKTGAGWRHLDATPGTHQKYPGPMTDEERYDSLTRGSVHRDWDRTMWPACD